MQDELFTSFYHIYYMKKAEKFPIRSFSAFLLLIENESNEMIDETAIG